MPETAENVAADFGVARVDQDAHALRSQSVRGRSPPADHRACRVTIPSKRVIRRSSTATSIRATTLESLAKPRRRARMERSPRATPRGSTTDRARRSLPPKPRAATA
jgi:acetyl-CoA acetyltransferase